MLVLSPFAQVEECAGDLRCRSPPTVPRHSRRLGTQPNVTAPAIDVRGVGGVRTAAGLGQSPPPLPR